MTELNNCRAFCKIPNSISMCKLKGGGGSILSPYSIRYNPIQIIVERGK